MIYHQGHVDLGDGKKYEKVAREALVVRLAYQHSSQQTSQQIR